MSFNPRASNFALSTLVIFFGLATSACAQTSPNQQADQANQLKEKVTQMVPESKIVKEDGLEFEVMTKNNTQMEIEFNRDNSIDEASGDAPLNGDVFQPGDNFISLDQAVQSLKTLGKTPSGDWQFEKSFVNGWVYEFDGLEDGKEMTYLINAQNGELVKSSRDWF